MESHSCTLHAVAITVSLYRSECDLLNIDLALRMETIYHLLKLPPPSIDLVLYSAGAKIRLANLVLVMKIPGFIRHS